MGTAAARRGGWGVKAWPWVSSDTWLSSDTLLAPSGPTGSPSTTDRTHQEAAETWEVHSEWQGLQRRRYQSFLSGPLLLPLRCRSCQDVVKLIRGFQARWKEDKTRGIVGNQPLYCFYGYCMLNLIQQELVKGEEDGRDPGFYKSCMFCVFDIPHLAEVGSRGQNLVRVSAWTSEIERPLWDWQEKKGMWPGHLGALLRKASWPWKAGIWLWNRGLQSPE